MLLQVRVPVELRGHLLRPVLGKGDRMGCGIVSPSRDRCQLASGLTVRMARASDIPHAVMMLQQRVPVKPLEHLLRKVLGKVHRKCFPDPRRLLLPVPTAHPPFPTSHEFLLQ